MIQITADNVTLGYDSKIILQNLNFYIEEGDYLCIIGENGSGKTTLMKTLLGLLKPIDGKIKFLNGIEKNQIGYLPQQTDVQKDFPASVKEIVISGFQSKMNGRPFYSKKEKAEALKNMQLLGIDNLARRSYRELSGGQQQRVLLARALCATNKMILLDEPVTGLDPAATNEMYELIKELNNQGITIIMITHDTSCALKYANKILEIGSKMFFGEKKDYDRHLNSIL
ncbi:MAG: ABC transporter ATP-binding protein [Spirochaetales bacterium]|nr:ABC transporter ATP-binding protein [Spirochaetales bacterium]